MAQPVTTVSCRKIDIFPLSRQWQFSLIKWHWNKETPLPSGAARGHGTDGAHGPKGHRSFSNTEKRLFSNTAKRSFSNTEKRSFPNTTPSEAHFSPFPRSHKLQVECRIPRAWPECVVATLESRYAHFQTTTAQQQSSHMMEGTHLAFRSTCGTQR